MSSIPMYAADYQSQYVFTQIGTVTSAQSALAVTARDNTSVVNLAAAKKVIWNVPIGTAAAILRFRFDGSNNDSNVIEVYASKGADYYTRMATLTVLQGQQDWSGGEFGDTITITNEEWGHGIRLDTTTDEIGRLLFNTGGFDRFLFIVSTLAATTVHIDIARLDKQIGGGIDDVTKELQDIEADVEALLGSTSLIKQSGAGGQELITIPASPFRVVGTAQACRSLILYAPSTNTGAIYISIDGGAADASTDFLIPQDVIFAVPVDNVDDCAFEGAVQNDVLYIMWRD